MPVISPSAYDFKQRINRRLQTLKTLPTTISVAVRLFELQKGAGAEGTEYARVIASDPGLTARILAVANSPCFGGAVRITRPLVAVNLLGVPNVRTLAINFCLSGLHHEMHLSAEEAHQFWQASICKAVAAKVLAQRVAPDLAEEAYVAGLFQDIALPVMLISAREQMTPLLATRVDAQARITEERKIFSADHAHFGRLLAKRLGLPESQIEWAGNHHDWDALRITAANRNCEALVAPIYAASLFPHRLDQWHKTDAENLRSFLASPDGGKIDLATYLGAVSEECQQQFSYFDRANTSRVRLMELLAEATGEAADEAVRLLSAVHEMASQVASADEAVIRMAQEQSRLLHEASRDPLTGALNRAGFQKDAVAAIERSAHTRHPVALLYADADGFKDVNDTCGHAAGDLALRQIASVIREVSRSSDILGRMGGDEFALLLPNCPENRALDIAQRICTQIGQRTVSRLDGSLRPLTVSIGLIGNAAEARVALDALLATADRRMYLAKKAGGGQVCSQSAE